MAWCVVIPATESTQGFEGFSNGKHTYIPFPMEYQAVCMVSRFPSGFTDRVDANVLAMYKKVRT